MNALFEDALRNIDEGDRVGLELHNENNEENIQRGKISLIYRG